MLTIVDVYRRLKGGMKGELDDVVEQRMRSEYMRAMAGAVEFPDITLPDCVFSRNPKACRAYEAKNAELLAEALGVDMSTVVPVLSEREEIELLKVRVAALEEVLRGMGGMA